MTTYTICAESHEREPKTPQGTEPNVFFGGQGMLLEIFDIMVFNF